MTMHLEKVYMNNYGKCKPKLNAKQTQAKMEHDAWLRKRGLHPDQIAAKKKLNPVRKEVIKEYVRPTQRIETSNTVGNGFAKPTNVYTGDNLIGIATMHKSNMVPVFRKEDAVAISNMRR